MSIQVLPFNENLSSSLGSKIGTALSEQIGEEINRYRLRKGLENVGQQQGQSLFQQLAGLASVPNIDPQLLGVLAPALQQQQMQQQALNLAKQRGQQPPNIQNLDRSQEQTEQTFQQPISPTPQQIDKDAAESFSKFPGAFGFDFRRAQADAKERKEQEYAVQLGVIQRGEQAVKAFDEKLERTLGKDYTLQANSIGYKLREQMRQRAKQLGAREGSSPDRVGERFASDTEKVIKSEQNLRDISDASNFDFFRPRDRQAVRELRNNLKVMKDQGVPLTDVIDTLATDLGTDRAFASYIADPLDDSKAASAIRRSPHVFLGSRNAEEKLAAKIADFIEPDDTIGSLVYLAERKGLNGRKFQQALQENIKFPSTYQTEQLNSVLLQGKPPIKQLWLQELGLVEERKKHGIRPR